MKASCDDGSPQPILALPKPLNPFASSRVARFTEEEKRGNAKQQGEAFGNNTWDTTEADAVAAALLNPCSCWVLEAKTEIYKP
jgi:hypothetical protein